MLLIIVITELGAYHRTVRERESKQITTHRKEASDSQTEGKDID